MSLASFVDVRSLRTIAPSPPRLWVGLRAAAAIGLPLVVSMATGHGTTGFLCSLGGFAVLYGAGSAVRHRARVIAGVGLGMWLCALAGVLTAGHPWATLAVIVALTSLAAWTTYALRIGAPGVFFFALSTGVANVATAGGQNPLLILGLALVGAVVALVVGTSDIWFRSHGVEEAAVAHAERNVARFAESRDAEALDQLRTDASAALHTAWTAVSDGGSQDRFAERLRRVHEQYADTTRRVTRHFTGIDVRPWEGETDPADDASVEPGGDLGRTDAEQRQVEQTQVRQTSLGRPDAAYLLRQAARWPSESILVAARVLVATAVAGGIATLLDNEHVYWAVAFAALIVQTGGSRRQQATKALHRVVGTTAGLGVFALVLRLELEGWWLVLFVVLLQGGVEIVVTRHYALAVTLITPLALTISAAVTGMPTATVVGDRALDTVIGVGTALVVLVLSGLGGHELMLRGHARRVAVAVQAVLDDLVVGAHGTADGLRRRQHLYAELLESDAVARRALADAPEQVGPFREMERVLSHVGYLVLGAAWHPGAADGRERFERARQELARTTGRPVTERRPAADLTAELRAVERALTGAG